MDQIGLFDTNTRGDLADRDAGGVRLLAVDSNYHTFLGYTHSVTRANIDDGRFLLCIPNFL